MRSGHAALRALLTNSSFSVDTPIHNSTPKPGNFTSNTSVESITDGDSTVINRNDVSDEDGSFLMTRRSTRQNTKKNIQIKKVKADG